MKTKTVNIALPSGLIKEVDKLAKQEYRNRSELIREALRAYILKTKKWEDVFAFGRKQAKKINIKNENDIDKIVDEFRHGRKVI